MNLEKSKKLFELASKLTVGGVHSPVRRLFHVEQTPIFMKKASGAYFYDEDGNKYIDFCMAFGPLLLGHAPKTTLESVCEQVGNGTVYGTCHALEVELCELILNAYPFLDKVRFMSTGSEAVMTAIRVARGFTGRTKILKFEGCYHGHSDGLLVKAGSGVSELSESSSKGVPSSYAVETLICKMDGNEIERIFNQYGNSLACVVCELVPANNGLFIAEKSLLQKLRALCDKYNVLLIADEVITGFRLGWHGACGYFDVKADLVTLGKVIGGGLPLSALVGRQDIMNGLAPIGNVYAAGTYNSNPLCVKAGIATLKWIQKEDPYSILEERTSFFVSEFKKIFQEFSFSQIASLFWFESLEKEKKVFIEFYQKALSYGLYFSPSPYEVHFLSVAHDESVLNEALEKLHQCRKNL